MPERVRQTRYHGRHEGAERRCAMAGCSEPGEFRAPGGRLAGADGPGEYRWLCLDHVREFNARYDFFRGMTSEEIADAQSPLHGWDNESRAFRACADVDHPPRWADYTDPLDAIATRARHRLRTARDHLRATAPLTPDQRRALDALGLNASADRKALRERYAALLRRYHPDHNGGDRSQEGRLQAVMRAYQLLREAPAFA